MPQSMVDPIAGKSFQIWMAKTFKNVGNPGKLMSPLIIIAPYYVHFIRHFEVC